MTHNKTQAFLDYWGRARGDKAMPGRGDIDPLDMPRFLLSDLFLVDVLDGGGDFRYRLIGSHIVEHTGADLTGRRLSDLRDRGSQPRLAALYSEVVHRKAPQQTRLPYKTPEMQAASHYDVVVAPLASDGRTVDMLVGIADYQPLTGLG